MTHRLYPHLSAALFICSLLASSCSVSRHPAGIAGSTMPVTSSYTVIGPVAASSCSYWIFYVPVSGMDSSDTMIDALVKQKGAHGLIGVTVEHEFSAFALPLFGSECTIVKGQAIRGTR
jgi:hypothetical protein